MHTNIATNDLAAGEAEGLEVTEAHRRRVQVYNDKLLRMPADKAARIILDGVAQGAPRVRVGNDAKLLDRVVRLFPQSYPRLAAYAERKLFGGR